MNKLASALEKAAMMAEAKPVIVAPKEPRVIVPEIPVWIADKYAAIAVHGSTLISKRTMNIIGACFQMPEMDEFDHNCRSILIRDDGEPGRMMAIAAYACKNMTLNLERIFEVSVEEILKNPEYSILFGWHRNVLLSTLHEINHLFLCHSAGEVDEHVEEARDNDADEWAWEKLVWMAKTMDIEPANPLEEPYFCKMTADWIETLKEPLKSRQLHMLENKVMLMLGEDMETAKFVNSFKQVIHSMTDDAIDDPEWKKGPGASMAEYVRDMTPVISTSNVVGGFPGEATTPIVPAETLAAQAGGFGVAQPQYATAPASFAPAQAPVPAHTPFTPAVAPTAQFTPANGGMAPVQPTQPVPTTLINHNLPPETIRDTVKAVIYKAYENIFRNCGWTTHSMTPFSNSEHVCMPIPLTDLEKQVVFAVDCSDEHGRACVAAPTTDGLRGSMTTKIKLPMYYLYINDNGTLLKRKVIPQNPATGSKIAQAAFDGHAIVIVMEGDRAIEEQLKPQGKYAHWYFKIDNHEWIDLRNGR